MIIIAAMSTDRIIGSGDGMPWSVPEEYRQFLDFIEGQTVIMGRCSYEIFGPDLTSAHNVVVSQSWEGEEGVVACGSIEEAAQRASSFGKKVFAAGGATIYEQTLPLADAMYISYIKGKFTGDTHFPEFDEGNWEVAERRDHERFEFVHYQRGGLYRYRAKTSCQA